MNNSQFEKVAQQAVQRILLAQCFNNLAKSAVVLFPLLTLLVLGCWLTESAMLDLWQVALVLVAWIGSTIAFTWSNRPTLVAALATWDERAGHSEVFTSALCFSEMPEPGLGEQLHIRKAIQKLETATPNLNKDLPTPLRHRAWLLPIFFVALVAVMPATSASTGEQTVDAKERQRAIDAANELAKQADLQHIEKDGLNDEEKKKLKELEDSLKESMDKMKELGEGENARDILAELEAKAHEAEKLAQALEGDAEGLSSEMIAELERHADTTEFGSALRSEELEDVAKESDELKKKLENEDLSKEEEERMEETLKKAMEKANDKDKETFVGKELEEALQRLKKDKPKDAAENFENIKENALQKGQRQLAKEQLKQLAQQLRQAGQKIFGQKQKGQIQQLGQQQQAQGLKQLNPQNGQQLQLPMPNGQLGKANPNAPAAMGPAPQGQPNQGKAPVPGQQPGNGQPNGTVPGQGQGQAPVPGLGQGQGQGQGKGQGQGQGQGQQGQGAGQGGLQAGNGSAGYGNTSTQALGAKKEDTVQGQINAQGESTVRQIDPSTHRENAERERQQAIAKILRSEEEALANEPLPASRRKQVLQYLTTLRRQLVDEPNK